MDAAPPPAAATPRLTFRRILAELVARHFDLDRGWMFTVRSMLLRPEQVLRHYLAGERQLYANPLTFLIAILALSLLIDALAGTMDRASADILNDPASSPRVIAFQQDFFAFIFRCADYMTWLILIPFTLLARVFFHRGGYNLAELLVWCLYLFGTVSLLHIALVTPVMILSVPAAQVLAPALTLGFLGYGFIRLFRRWLWTTVRVAAAFTLSFGFLATVIVLSAGVYLTLIDPGRLTDQSWDLFRAIDQGRAPVARALIRDGTDVDSESRQRPLHRAAETGQTEIAVLLLAAGADPNARDHLGRTPAHLALTHRHAELARQLAQVGTDPDAAAQDGTTLLMAAAERGDWSFAAWALEHGSRVNAVRPHREHPSALMIAVAADHPAMVALLLEHGADPELTNEEGRRARDLARSDEVRRLLTAPAGPGSDGR